MAAGIQQLEVWANGSLAQVDGARVALATLGRIVEATEPRKVDAGRFQQYLRVEVTSR